MPRPFPVEKKEGVKLAGWPWQDVVAGWTERAQGRPREFPRRICGWCKKMGLVGLCS